MFYTESDFVACPHHYHHRYHQHFTSCAIGHYMYCRTRNTNDCLLLR